MKTRSGGLHDIENPSSYLIFERKKFLKKGWEKVEKIANLWNDLSQNCKSLKFSHRNDSCYIDKRLLATNNKQTSFIPEQQHFLKHLADKAAGISHSIDISYQVCVIRSKVWDFVPLYRITHTYYRYTHSRYSVLDFMTDYIADNSDIKST